MWNTQLFQTYTGWKINDKRKKYDFKLHSEHCLLFDWICSFSLSLSFVSHPAWDPLLPLGIQHCLCCIHIQRDNFPGSKQWVGSVIHFSPEAFNLNDCSFCRLKWLMMVIFIILSHDRFLTFVKFIFKLRTNYLISRCNSLHFEYDWSVAE